MHRTSILVASIFFGALSLGTSASAQVYKCKDAKGAVRYADSPCDAAGGGEIIEQKRSAQELERERSEAAQAIERKYRDRTRTDEAPAAAPPVAAAPAIQSAEGSTACKAARKELDFVSSIRTISQDEKRMRVNSVIAQVNAACGTNTPLMQEPDKVIIHPAQTPYTSIPRGR